MAFDEHRSFLSCIFCGSTKNLTKEHLFGRAVAKRFPVKHQWRASSVGTVVKGGGPITSVTARLACEKCNHGRLSRIMEEGLKPLMRLIDGKPHQITPQERAALSRYWVRVGLIVDAMTSNFQLKAPNEDRLSPPRYSEAQRKAWIDDIDGGKLLDMHVHIGFHDGVLGLDPYVNIVRGMDLRTGQPIKRFLTTIGNLSAHIWMVERPFPVSESWRDLADHQNWDWPGTVPPVSYEDFFGLCYPDPDIVAKIQLMSNSEWRQKVEEYSKQKGSFKLPPALDPLFRDLVKKAAAAAHLTVRSPPIGVPFDLPKP